MNHLDNDRFGDSILFHQVEQHFGSRVALRHARALGERKLRVVFPHVHVRIDNANVQFFAACKWRRAVPWSSTRRETSRIHVLQKLRNVTAAALVTGSRPLTRDVEVDNQPSLESDRLQHSMAGRKIYLAVPQVGDAFAIETVRSGARQVAGILVIRQHDPALVLFERLRHIAAAR